MDNIENKDVETRKEPQVDASALIAQERSRIADINKTVRSAGLSTESAEKLIGDGTTIEVARSLILDEMIKKQPQITNTTSFSFCKSNHTAECPLLKHLGPEEFNKLGSRVCNVNHLDH